MNHKLNTRGERRSVVVVGAGSTGMATALELRRHGVDVTLIDAAPSPCTESRGTGLQPRTLELLDIHGLGDRLLALGNPIRAMTTFRHGVEVGRVDFTLTPSRYNLSPALPQSRTEGVLRDRLAELGVTPCWGHSLSGLQQDGNGVHAQVQTPDGEVTLSADWLVGADGARSAARRLLDLPFEGMSYPEGWGLLDVTLQWDLPGNEVRIYRLDGPQQFVVVPLGGTNYRLQLDHRPDARAGQRPTLDEMRDAFERYTGQRGTISDPTWASAFNIHRRQVVAYRRGRVFLAGDAAHIHTPAGGQGLNTGIQDGLNLGWKLALVARGEADASLLDTYEDERKPIAAGVLELSEVLARRPEVLMGDGSITPTALATRVGQLLVNYRGGPLGQPARGPGRLGAGDRLPDVLVDGRRSYHAIGDARVVLALVGTGPATAAAADALRTRLPAMASVWQLGADAELAQAIGLAEGAFAIRPDGYLGLVAEGLPQAAADTVLDWLATRLLRRPALAHA